MRHVRLKCTLLFLPSLCFVKVHRRIVWVSQSRTEESSSILFNDFTEKSLRTTVRVKVLELAYGGETIK